MANMSSGFQIAVILLSFMLGYDEAEAGGVIGFSTELIPRSSPLSPLYDPSKSEYEHLKDAIQRSWKRASKIYAPLKRGDGGDYVMRVSIGTPPVEAFLLADTGSDLTWTQCQPCRNCFNQTLPIFDPGRSCTFKSISCNSNTCQEMPSYAKTGCDRNNACTYKFEYGDNSSTVGDLASESFRIGSLVVPNIAFGCSHESVGLFFKTDNGIIGLGGGSLSFVSQLGENARKFSYCLPPTLSNVTTKISFGSDAIVSGSAVLTTPIIIRTPVTQKTFYFLTLQSLTVCSNHNNNKTIPLPLPESNQNQQEEGNIIIDSGTFLTFLPKDTVDQLESALEEAISFPKTSAPTQRYNLCYRVRGFDDLFAFPKITAHFKGADVLLNPANTFLRATQDVVCLAIVPSPDQSLNIFGNRAQENFLVGYDLDALTLSFKPTDCTKQDYI
ncbi:hypothetical protein PIB30_086685 [Stylosanthes scabra]|uniref:Peptidase A1 domain-containing protein n=1 Tax=Stylosanthes scabra TaxID=79078 RepID=A0ABU6XVR6_9FABA|nr:hypothetical protein [Stylosanthes scabra]